MNSFLRDNRWFPGLGRAGWQAMQHANKLFIINFIAFSSQNRAALESRRRPILASYTGAIADGKRLPH